MAIERVYLLGIRANIDEIGFRLGWKDDAGFHGQLDFTQDLPTGIIKVDSEHMSKAFVISVLHALGENAEVKDK